MIAAIYTGPEIIGGPAFMAAFGLVTVWALFLFFRIRIRRCWLRFLSCAFLAVTLSSLLGISQSSVLDPSFFHGGIFGNWIYANCKLSQTLGLVFFLSWLGFIGSMLLSTDWLFHEYLTSALGLTPKTAPSIAPPAQRSSSSPKATPLPVKPSPERSQLEKFSSERPSPEMLKPVPRRSLTDPHHTVKIQAVQEPHPQPVEQEENSQKLWGRGRDLSGQTQLSALQEATLDAAQPAGETRSTDLEFTGSIQPLDSEKAVESDDHLIVGEGSDLSSAESGAALYEETNEEAVIPEVAAPEEKWEPEDAEEDEYEEVEDDQDEDGEEYEIVEDDDEDAEEYEIVEVEDDEDGEEYEIVEDDGEDAEEYEELEGEQDEDGEEYEIVEVEDDEDAEEYEELEGEQDEDAEEYEIVEDDQDEKSEAGNGSDARIYDNGGQASNSDNVMYEGSTEARPTVTDETGSFQAGFDNGSEENTESHSQQDDKSDERGIPVTPRALQKGLFPTHEWWVAPEAGKRKSKKNPPSQ